MISDLRLYSYTAKLMQVNIFDHFDLQNTGKMHPKMFMFSIGNFMYAEEKKSHLKKEENKIEILGKG